MAAFPANFNVTSLKGVSGFSITGFPASSAGGLSVSGAGDINGDGTPSSFCIFRVHYRLDLLFDSKQLIIN